MLARYIKITGKGKAECKTEEISTENLLENEAIIRTEASLISAGTELSRVFAIKQGVTYPVRVGYSSVGRVLAKGDGLADLKVGDRVFFSAPHASVSRFSRGNRTQGPAIYKIPQDMDAAHATLLNLGLVAMNGVNSTEIKLGDTLAVFGLGTIGLIAAALYRELGARVIGVDPVASRCKLANQLGIKETVSCAPELQAEAVKQLNGGRGVDIAVDVSGLSSAIMNAAACCGNYSQLVLLGSPRAPHMCDITPFLSTLHMKNIRVTGAFNALYPVFPTEGSRLCVERSFDVVCSRLYDGRINAKKLISQTVSPDEVEGAYHGLMFNKEKYRCVVIDWSEERKLDK